MYKTKYIFMYLQNQRQIFKLDFSNLPLSIFGGGIISAVFAWGGGGLGLSRVQKKTLCLVSFVCYVGCATCCATCIGIEIHGAQGNVIQNLQSLLNVSFLFLTVFTVSAFTVSLSSFLTHTCIY